MVPGQVFAHATWDEIPASPTKPRVNQDIKTGPCGGVPRGNTPLVSTPNAIIDIQFKETVPHPGFFTVSFSESNDLNFKFPKKILHLQDYFTYKEKYTMPNELCNDCTLQLIQTMLNDPYPATFYYSCTDITLKSPDINARITQPLAKNAAISPGDTSIKLTWDNPGNSTFYKILIVSNDPGVSPNTDPTVDLDKKLFKFGDKINANKNNDIVVYNGKVNSAVFESLKNGNQYTYQIFAYDINLNYSSAITLSATPSTTNVAPTVALQVNQGIYTGKNVYQNGTNIVITANVTDGNLNDKHTFAWTSNDFTDNDGVDKTFTIKGSDITSLPIDSTYTIAVTTIDNGAGALTGSSSIDITLKSTPPPLNVGNDVINNIADNGGCTISSSAKFDPTLLLLLLFSLTILIARITKQNTTELD